MAVQVLMRFPPVWDFVDRVREFTGFYCEKAFAAGVAERVRVVIQESLENAMLNGSPVRHEIRLAISSEAEYLEIEITSASDGTHAARLKQDLATIASLPPKEAYIHALTEAICDPAGGHRVGLARMRYEGGMDLAAEERQDGSLRFSARGRL